MKRFLVMTTANASLNGKPDSDGKLRTAFHQALLEKVTKFAERENLLAELELGTVNGIRAASGGLRLICTDAFVTALKEEKMPEIKFIHEKTPASGDEHRPTLQ